MAVLLPANKTVTPSWPYPYGLEYQIHTSPFYCLRCIVGDVCGLRSPSFESSRVLYITRTYTSSMQDLIVQGMQQKLHKSWSWCNKNTWHVESNYILQPPKYLLLIVNRFRYTNNNVKKDRCSIPMDTTVLPGPLLIKFSSLAAPKVVKMTTFGEAGDENFMKMTTFPFHFDNFQCS